jgi:hypothetical protein
MPGLAVERAATISATAASISATPARKVAQALGGVSILLAEKSNYGFEPGEFLREDLN